MAVTTLTLQSPAANTGVNMGTFTLDTLFKTSNYTSFVKSPTNLKLTSSANTYIEFIGTGFDTGGVNTLTAFSGNITGIKIVKNGIAIYDYSGLNVDASALYVAWQENPTNPGLNFLIGGGATISGTAFVDTLIGDAGADSLDGGVGADTMKGGNGSDTYVVDNVGDIVDESAGSGTDLVKSSITFSLADAAHARGSIENLTLTGSSAINGTGNGLANTITGNSGDNTLSGGLGADKLNGGDGNDILIGGADADKLDGGSGTDTASYIGSSAAVNVSLTSGNGIGGDAEGDKLSTIENVTGSANAGDTIEGNAVNNVLDGGAGANDTVTYENALAAVKVSLATAVSQNTVGAGSDTLKGFENLTGSGFNDTLTGDAGNNVLRGLAGNDTLDGGAGADKLIGGNGDDTYVVDNVGDIVDESDGTGKDVVQSSINFSLADAVHVLGSVENLTLTGSTAINATGNNLANTITGNSANNLVEGGAGGDTMDGGAGIDTLSYQHSAVGVTVTLNSSVAATGGDAAGDKSVNFENLTGSANDDTLNGDANANVINGGGGADRMAGGAGDDTYIADNTSDVVSENASGGTDLVKSSVNFTLGSNVENLILTGSSAINGTGNSVDNQITGNDSANILDGNSGNDTLNGMGGEDVLRGGIGNDKLDGGTGNDVLIGGTGADNLTGGKGNDNFIFSAVSDSSANSGNFDSAAGDTITDFTTTKDITDGKAVAGDHDMIDLSALVSTYGLLTFTGTKATAKGIWYANTTITSGGIFGIGSSTSPGPTFVYVDTTGDAKADFVIKLPPSKTLSAKDFILDVTPPAKLSVSLLNDTGSSNSDLLTNDGSLKFGNKEATAKVEYSTNGIDGWKSTFTPHDGNNDIYVRQVDASGNVGPASEKFSFNYDHTAPNAPTNLKNAAIANGYVNAAHNVDGQAITGKAEANSIVTVTDGTTTKITAADDDGVWSVTIDQLSEGSHTFTATAKDAAGNVSSTSSGLTFNVDTKAPAAPTVMLNADTGTLNTDKITKDGTLQVTTAEAGGTKEYSVDNGSHWTSSFTATEGANTVQVHQVDAAGNVGADATFSFTLDTTVPDAPVDLIDDAISNGFVNKNNNTVGQTISGTSEANSIVTLKDGSTPYTSVKADANGAWSVTVGVLTEGNHNFTATAKDAAGNVSSASDILTVKVDLTAPAAPTGVALANDSGASDSDTITNDGSLKIGNIENGATLEYSTDGTTWSADLPSYGPGSNDVYVRQVDAAGNESNSSSKFTFTYDTDAPATPGIVSLVHDTGTLTADKVSSDGSLQINNSEASATLQYSANGVDGWSATFIPQDGINNVYVRQVDVAGNASGTSGKFTFTYDATAPDAPAGLTDAAITNGYVNAANNGSGQTISGTAEANSLVTVTDGSMVKVTTADEQGAWSVTVGILSTGSHTFTATSQDAAGNVSTASTGLTFIVDTTAPATPAVVSLVTDSGTFGSDKITNDGHLQISNLETNATLQYSADGSTGWSSTFSPQDGNNDVYVRQVDAAGNVSGASGKFTFTYDKTAPVAPTGLGDSAILNGFVNATHNIVGQTITGTAEANSIVAVTDGTTTKTANADGLGAWSVTVDDLSEGSHTFTATAKDVAGNTGPASTGLTFVVDTTAPDAPLTVSLVTDSGASTSDTVTNDGHLQISNLETNATLQYSANGTTGWSSSFIPSQGSNDVFVRQVDAAGNAGDASAKFTFTYDTVKPTAPTISLTTDSGISETDHLTNVGTLTVSDPESGGKIEYSINGGSTWTDTFTAKEGANTVQVQSLDKAGNVSDATTLTFTLDTKTPGAPTVTLANDTGGSNSDKITADGTLHITAAELGGVIAQTMPSPGDGLKSVTVFQIDDAGNVGAMKTITYTLDTAKPTAPTLSNAAAGDHYYNSAENGVDQVFSGTAEKGSTVTLLDGSTILSSVVAAQDGTWSITVAHDTFSDGSSHTVTAMATDAAGNISSASSALTFTVDATPPDASIALDAITSDNSLDSTETAANVAVTGTVGGDVHNGDIVTLTVNGTDYTGAVSGTTFNISIPGSALTGDSDLTVDASVKTFDAAGNSATATDHHAYAVFNDLNGPTFTGTANADYFHGTGADEIFNDVSTGDKVVSGGGADEIHLGAGLPLLVDGGVDFSTLYVDAFSFADLTGSNGSHFKNIAAIQLDDANGAVTLSLDVAGAASMVQSGSFVEIYGTVDDNLHLVGSWHFDSGSGHYTNGSADVQPSSAIFVSVDNLLA